MTSCEPTFAPMIIYEHAFIHMLALNEIEIVSNKVVESQDRQGHVNTDRTMNTVSDKMSCVLERKPLSWMQWLCYGREPLPSQPSFENP